jgi:hypothetical protein
VEQFDYNKSVKKIMNKWRYTLKKSTSPNRRFTLINLQALMFRIGLFDEFVKHFFELARTNASIFSQNPLT